MKPLIFCLLSTLAFAAQAEQMPNANSLAPTENSRILKVMNEALQDKNITQQQYDQTLYWLHATPCKGVDRTLKPTQRVKLEAAIARQQQRETVSVFESFKAGGWSIIFSDASVGDSPYFFYSKDPLKGAEPVTVWSGGATLYETGEIVDWVKQEAPGIPQRLANCFAWSVTIGH